MKLHLSAFLQWKINVYLYRTIGWALAYRYIRWLGKLYFFMKKSEKRIVSESVGTVFASTCSPADLRRLRRAVFNGIITHYYEKLFNAFSSEQASRGFFHSRVADDGLSVIREAMAEGRGVLLITGHFGGVEYIPGYLGANGLPSSILVRFATDHLRQLSIRK